MKLPSLLASTILVSSALVAAFGSSCDVLRSTAKTSGRIAGSIFPGAKPGGPPVERILSDAMRYSDQIVSRVEEASHQFETSAGTQEAWLQAARWRLETIRWATKLASGQSSVTSLIDLVIATTAARWLHEEHWSHVWGEANRPLLIAFERSEQDGWQLLESYLAPPVVEQVRVVLDEWHAENTPVAPASLLGFPGFAALAQEQQASGQGSSANLLGFVGLDPLSGLEPAARQVELARQLGQRMLFFLQRSPQLVAAEIEVGVLGSSQSSAVRQVLADAQRLTTAAESFAATAAALPEAFRAERDATVRQVSEELTVQRQGLVQDLETARAPLETLLTQTEATLAAGERMSAGVAEAVRALDGFVGRFDEIPTESAPPVEPGEPSKPFDVVEYGAAAERVGAAAHELTRLLAELDRGLPQMERVLDTAAERGERSLNRVLWRALVVGLILIGAAASAALFVRRIGARGSGKSSGLAD